MVKQEWKVIPPQSRYVQILHSAELNHWVGIANLNGCHTLPLPCDIQKQIVQFLGLRAAGTNCRTGSAADQWSRLWSFDIAFGTQLWRETK